MPRINTLTNTADAVVNTNENTNVGNPLRKFTERGFSDAEKPLDENPKMPTQLSHLQTTELGDLMAKYCAWREYSEGLHAVAVHDFLLASEEHRFEYAKKFVVTSERTEIARKKVLEADAELHRNSQKVTEKELYKDLLSRKIESYNNCISVISREITRRGQEPNFDK